MKFKKQNKKHRQGSWTYWGMNDQGVNVDASKVFAVKDLSLDWINAVFASRIF